MRRQPKIVAEEYLPVAEEMLNLLNRVDIYAREPTIKLTRRNEGIHLDLTQRPYRIYSVATPGADLFNILSPLKPTSIDISGLPLKTLNEFHTLKVREVKMVGVKINRPNMMVKSLAIMKVEKSLPIRIYTAKRLSKNCDPSAP